MAARDENHSLCFSNTFYFTESSEKIRMMSCQKKQKGKGRSG